MKQQAHKVLRRRRIGQKTAGSIDERKLVALMDEWSGRCVYCKMNRLEEDGHRKKVRVEWVGGQ